MTATPAVIGLSAGNRLLSTPFGPTDLHPDKTNINLGAGPDAHASSLQFAPPTASNLTVVAHRLKLSPHHRAQVMRALRQSAPSLAAPPPASPTDPAQAPNAAEFELESSLEAIVLLQRSMLEKQWVLPFDDDDDELAIGSAEDDVNGVEDEEDKATVVVARSGVSARQRRMSGRRRGRSKNGAAHFTISPELLQSRNRIYLRGTVSKELLTHKQVVQLSKKIKDGIWLQQQRSKYADYITIYNATNN